MFSNDRLMSIKLCCWSSRAIQNVLNWVKPQNSTLATTTLTTIRAKALAAKLVHVDFHALIVFLASFQPPTSETFRAAASKVRGPFRTIKLITSYKVSAAAIVVSSAFVS